MDYHGLQMMLEALIGGVPHRISNLANAAALLMHELPDVSWAGFYLTEEKNAGIRTAASGELAEFIGASGKMSRERGTSEKMLVLGPFQGKTACIEIPWGRGVCGTAAETKRTQLIPDVHAFPGHIACDAASRSELVVPLFDGDGEVAGVLDLDSASPARFNEEDRSGLEGFARILEKEVFPRA